MLEFNLCNNEELINMAQDEIDDSKNNIQIILYELESLNEILDNIKQKFDELKSAETNEESKDILTQISEYSVELIAKDMSIKEHYPYFEKYFSMIFKIEFLLMKNKFGISLDEILFE